MHVAIKYVAAPELKIFEVFELVEGFVQKKHFHRAKLADIAGKDSQLLGIIGLRQMRWRRQWPQNVANGIGWMRVDLQAPICGSTVYPAPA